MIVICFGNMLYEVELAKTPLKQSKTSEGESTVEEISLEYLDDKAKFDGLESMDSEAMVQTMGTNLISCT